MVVQKIYRMVQEIQCLKEPCVGEMHSRTQFYCTTHTTSPKIMRHSRLATDVASPSNRLVWRARGETRIALEGHGGIDECACPTTPFRTNVLGGRRIRRWAIARGLGNGFSSGTSWRFDHRTSNSRDGDLLGLRNGKFGRSRSRRRRIYDNSIGIIVRVESKIYGVVCNAFICRLVRLPLGHFSGSTSLLVSSAALSSLRQ
jgi:hypothetical protein